MADEEPWKLSEDGYLNADFESKSVICHPNLNVILLVTKSNELIVIDVNSGSVLQRSSLSAKPSGCVQGAYLAGTDKLLLTDGSAVGVRSDYNGVLLLDTILQPPLQKTDDIVRLELLYTEAVLLQRCLRQIDLPGVYQTTEVLQELTNRTKETQGRPRRTIKSQKWNSVCLELPHSVLKPVCAGLLAELKRQNRHIPVLPVVSALNERLNSLLSYSSLDPGGGSATAERCLMYSEAARRETFTKWPHMNYKWALPDQMAQAGFYHQPNSAGDDRAMCFTCVVCLVCWEPTDEPWSEHERHSPTCPFVKGEYTQNVPLSVTYATGPASPVAPSSAEEMCFEGKNDNLMLGTSNAPELTVTVTSGGLVNIWNAQRQLKREASFWVTGAELQLVNKHFRIQEQSQQKLKLKQNKPHSSDVNSPESETVQKVERDQSDCDLYADVPKPPREAWLRDDDDDEDTDSEENTAEISLADANIDDFVPKSPAAELHAASIVSGCNPRRNSSRLQPVAVIGVELSPPSYKCPRRDPPTWGGSCDVVRIMNDANQASSCEGGTLDIMRVNQDSSQACSSFHLERGSSLYLVVYDFYQNQTADESDDDGGNSGESSGSTSGTGSGSGTGSNSGSGSGSGKKMDKSVAAQVGGSTKKYVSGTGTSASSTGTRQENNMYQDIFLPKFLYDSPVIQDGDAGIIISGSTDGMMNGLEFSPTTSMFSPPDYTLNMLQMTLSNSSGGGTSIIPHSLLNGYLGDVKKSCSKKDEASASIQEVIKNKDFEPVAVQCVPLPSGYRIHSTHPTKDGCFLLVVLTSRRDCDGGGVECDGATAMDVDGEDLEARTGPGVHPSMFLMFSLDVTSDVVRIEEEPIRVKELPKPGDAPVEVSLLPLQDREENNDTGEMENGQICGQPSGLASVVCLNGKLRILDLASLKFVADAIPNVEAKFVSATYCNNLERICACTDNGSLHFFTLRWNGMGMMSVMPGPSQPQPSTSAGSSSSGAHVDGSSGYSTELLVNSSLRLADLRQLVELTQCENLTPCYAATVPPCWSEMMQAQKQRRHPQHLQQGDDAQNTRTWRLQRDATTWDEHIFEITLPKSCTVAHVCFKFSLQSLCSPPPNIQVTLLKQNVSGVGHKQPSPMPVDTKVDFGLCGDSSTSREWTENPVLSEEYLRAHNAEILCGPVNLANCLDLSDQGGSIILTSPTLIRSRGRTLQLHLKSLSVDSSNVPRGMEEKPSSKKSRMDGSMNVTSNSGASSSNKPLLLTGSSGSTIKGQSKNAPCTVPLKKAESFLGCDWLQEVSIAIRRTKQTSITYERSQRCAMLESNSFVERLLRVVCLEGPDKTSPAQSLALDVLSWVTSIRLSPHRLGFGDGNNGLNSGKQQQQQLEIGRIIKAHLPRLIQHCFILGGRSIAHKCLKLILACVEGVKSIRESEGCDLETAVLESLLEWLPAVGGIKSAGGLRWFLLLLMRVGPLDTASIVANHCVSLLTHVAQELSTRSNPYHLLLRTRFGLYGTPFEPELFDLEPPVSVKSMSMPLTYASVVQGDTGVTSGTTFGSVLGGGPGLMNDTLDLRELLAVPILLSPEKASGSNSNTNGGGTSASTSSSCNVGNTSAGNGSSPPSTTPSRLRGLASSHYMRGLLEVEPLHYTCHAASDGTKLEKIEPGCGCTIPVSNFISLGTTGTKKADSDFMCFCPPCPGEGKGKAVPEDRWKKLQSRLSYLNQLVESKLTSILHGEQVKPLGLISQEGESSSTSSSQQSSTNSSPWLPQYAHAPAPKEKDALLTNSKSQTQSQSQPAHSKEDHEHDCEDHDIPTCSTKKSDGKKEEDLSSLLMPWQQLLVAPPQQTVVIERMHSGARRFVVLDFGAAVLLTDVMVPACSDLLLLSVDVWLCSEEQDGQRLVVASDIATKALVLSDLQPPPICRYLKITTIGRYGMTATRCKIPIGSFFGHTMIVPGESNPEHAHIPALSETNLQAQISVLGALLEDVQCRYSLACSRLRELLAPLLQAETPNAAHMHCYLQRTRDADRLMSSNQDHQRVFAAYQECITFQHQLNVVRSVMTRLEVARSTPEPVLTSDCDSRQLVMQCSTDKLRILGEGLLDVLLYLGSIPRLSVPMERSVCEQLFYWLCVGEDTSMQLSSATLLVRLCGTETWWGEFLADTVADLFCSNNTTVFPQDRVFILLAYLGRKSLTLPSARPGVLEAVLGMLGRLLEPLCSERDIQPLRAHIDLALIGWALLFVSQCLDVGSSMREDDNDKPISKDQGQQSRWDFIQGEVAMQKKAAAGGARGRGNVARTKRIMVHKQQLGNLQDDFEVAKKAFHASTQALSALSSQAANLSNKLDMALKHQEQYFKKAIKANHLKEAAVSLRRLDATKRAWAGGSRRPSGASASSERTESDGSSELRESATSMWLPQSHCLPVARGLISLILSMDFTCNIDMFLLACKVLARIVWCSRPALALGDLMTSDQLLRLVRMAVWHGPHQTSWGGPWAAHAITCLLQDVLEGLKVSPSSNTRDGSPSEEIPESRPGTNRPTPGPPSRPVHHKFRGGWGPLSFSHPSSFTIDEPTADVDQGGEATGLSSSAAASQADPCTSAPSTSGLSSSKGAAGGSSSPNAVGAFLEFISDKDGSDMILECTENPVPQPGGSSSGKGIGVLESDDSELDDFLDDILEHGRSLLKKGGICRTSMTASSSISAAMDSRLEYAVDFHAEVLLRRLTMLGAYNLPFSLNSLFPPSPSEIEKPLPPPPIWQQPEHEPLASLSMLTTCFDRVFSELQLQGSWASLELVLQLWLTLNMDTSFDSVIHQFDPSSCPIVCLSPSAVCGLLSALTWQPETSVRTWCLAFQCLTQVSNTPNADSSARWGTGAPHGMANVISSDTQFVPMLLRFLSGTGLGSQHTDVGPNVCGAMRDLLVRLMVRSDVGPMWKPAGYMSQILLRVANQLISPGGAVAGNHGPLDAQCAFFNLLLGYNFTCDTTDLGLTTSFLESVGILIHGYILTSEKVRSRSVTETNQNSSMCFGGLLSHVIGGELKPPKTSSWDSLMCAVLKLACSLVQAPLQRVESTSENMELSDNTSAKGTQTDMSQTDEHKAQNMGSAGSSSQTEVRVPCVADTVLQHQATMVRLLRALAGCVGSPLAVLLGTRGERDAREPRALTSAISGEPLSVGDGIFHLLLMLCKKASHPRLLLRPVFDFLTSVRDGSHIVPNSQRAGALQLSEPLLWFIMKALDNQDSLALFNTMGGVKVICENLVHSSKVLISSHPSLVSVVMQHLSRVSSMPPTLPKKPSALETYEGLQNFAPLGTISSSSPTAQPADVLIQSSPSHRRARTPAWSYHFYPDEMYMDLTLRLPCAVLLREVQLQPHLTSLATCPSAVGLEVSRDGSSPLIPVCAPLPTSGMTFVRLTLDKPEVVTCVLLRMYRPHDSPNIGLSQVRLLGSTTFGETSYRAQNSDVPEEEHLTKTSLGWLRLLHHCLVVSGTQSELQSSLVGSAAQVDGLLDACGGLLLLPAPVPPLMTTALERVLLHLGLHSRELGLHLMQGLLCSSPTTQLVGASPVGVGVGSDSVVDLLYLLGTTRDAFTGSRVETMLNWLQEMATSAHQKSMVQTKLQCANEMQISAACIHSVAAVLWDNWTGTVDYDLPALIASKVFIDIYQWTLLLPAENALKSALDAVLCSMCHIQPELFPTLLQTIGAVAPSVNSSSDDTKDMEQDGGGAMTDDCKQAIGAWSWNVHLSEGQLMTIALACQSPPAVRHLLDSGLPNLLAHSLLDFCYQEQEDDSKPYSSQCSSSRLTDADKAGNTTTVETMASILKLFAEFCSEGQLRDWLGSVDGSVFWLPLLKLLCTRSSRQSGRIEPSGHGYANLEIATLQFLSRCCTCHPENQLRLATVLCNVISQQEARSHNVSFLHGLSGFTRRLVLQLLLESEKLRVLVRADSPLQRPAGTISGVGLRHPSHGVGHHSQLLVLSTQATCADVMKMVVGHNSLAPILGERSIPDNSSSSAVAGTSGTCSGIKKQSKDITEFGLCFTDPLSFAAGLTAKDKRSKDAKNTATRGPFAKKTRISDPNSSGGLSVSAGLGLSSEWWLEHPELLPGVALPGTLTLGQLLVALQDRGHSLCSSCIELTLKQGSGKDGINHPKDGTANELTSLMVLPTPLQVFTAQGGLALLAQHLPLVYPETLRYSAPDKPAAGQGTSQVPGVQGVGVSSPDAMDSDWVKVDGSNIDLYEDLDDSSLLVGSSSPHSTSRPTTAALMPTSVPPHSLAAFGLFLRLPGYAEVLLRDRRKAQCLLRLVLGVSDDGEGGDILSLPLASSLPTLPFQVLRQLLDATPLHTDDGVVLRRTAMDVGAVHLLLACLAVFTHQNQDILLPGVQHELVIAATRVSAGNTQDIKPVKSDDKSQLYWAKGTGFGTGSTAQSWNVEQALSRQRSEEEHVTALLQAISSCLNPGDMMPPHFHDSGSDSDSDGGDMHSDQLRLPSQLPTLLQQSCLLPAICSYLRNDSVLDMARHIPLYRAVLQVLRALAVCPQLASLLLPAHRRYNRGGANSMNDGSSDSLSATCLLNKMKNCVDTYASRLKLNRSKSSRKSSGPGSGPSSRLPNKFVEELEQDEGLAQLIADIQHTASLVQVATDRLVIDDDVDSCSPSAAGGAIERPLKRTLEERYLEVMQKLQFDTYEMITENSEGGYQFAVSYHFESNLRSAGERCHPARVKRLAQETVTLSTSLPLSYSSSVYVRCDADRLDIMKVLITGPAETPYANGCYEFDVYFPPDYPNSPMLINMETTGHHTVRFNPNLYNDGKVCLSVLNTWHGRPEEKWNAQTSSFLQVLVSIQSLILVPEPYFNEPGYERSRGTPSGNQSSREYNANICQSSVKWAMLEQVRNPCPCFREVIHSHFWFKKREILQQIQSWLTDMESQGADRRNGRSMTMNTMALKRHFEQLREELNKLKPPPGMEDLAEQLEAEDESMPTPSTSPGVTTTATPSVPSPAPSPAPSPPPDSVPVAMTDYYEHEPDPDPASDVDVDVDVDTDMEMEKIVSKVCE